MAIDKAGYPYMAGALIPAVVLLMMGLVGSAFLLALVGVAFALFFRDPERQPPVAPNAVLAPADGRVIVVGEPQPGVAPPGEWRQISIFLSPLDVHVNRMPVAGNITRVDYHPGQYLPAYREEAATRNERNEIWIDCAGTTVVCRQVTGVLVRRVVCRVGPGDRVEAGQRFGVMKFGSRIDLFLPPRAELLVPKGIRVRAAETILARLP